MSLIDLLNVFRTEVLAVDNAELLSIEGSLALATFEATLVVGLIVVQYILFRWVNYHSTARAAWLKFLFPTIDAVRNFIFAVEGLVSQLAFASSTDKTFWMPSFFLRRCYCRRRCRRSPFSGAAAAAAICTGTSVTGLSGGAEGGGRARGVPEGGSDAAGGPSSGGSGSGSSSSSSSRGRACA